LAITDDPSLADHPAAVPFVGDGYAGDVPAGARLAEWDDAPDVIESIVRARQSAPELIAAVRLPLGPDAAERSLELAGQGADVFHLLADWQGYVGGRHVTDAVREVHLAFVKQGTRDEVTLIAGGGISMAEHLAKSMICGADLVSVDVPIMIALEGRLCENCRRGLKCPIDLEGVDPHYAVQRIVNLMGAWHS
jgi:hypothetical protein